MKSPETYYCPHDDYILTESDIWYASVQDPRCPHCNQPVDHMGDSDPTAYDTLEEKAL